jgi:hypothetical protein
VTNDGEADSDELMQSLTRLTCLHPSQDALFLPLVWYSESELQPYKCTYITVNDGDI